GPPPGHPRRRGQGRPRTGRAAAAPALAAADGPGALLGVRPFRGRRQQPPPGGAARPGHGPGHLAVPLPDPAPAGHRPPRRPVRLHADGRRNGGLRQAEADRPEVVGAEEAEEAEGAGSGTTIPEPAPSAEPSGRRDLTPRLGPPRS